MRPSRAHHSPGMSRAWASYRQMSVRLDGALGRELAEATGLSQADFEVLVALLDHPADSVRDITLRCGLEWEKSRLSHQLRRMEGRGLVSRGGCIEDNRSSTVSITEAGIEAAERGRGVQAAFLDRHLGAALSADRLEQLAEISEAILDGLESIPAHEPTRSASARRRPRSGAPDARSEGHRER